MKTLMLVIVGAPLLLIAVGGLGLWAVSEFIKWIFSD